MLWSAALSFSGDIIALKPTDKWTPREYREFLIVEVDGFEPDQLEALVEFQWDTNSYPAIPDETVTDLVAKGETIQVRPQRHIFKRRFHIPVEELTARGVDMGKLMDREQEYKPSLRFTKTDISDRVRGTKIPTDAKMRLLEPLTVGRVL